MSRTAPSDCVKPTIDTSASDLRQHPRVVCVDGGVLRLAIRPEFRGRRAVLIDVSAGGIGFVLQDALPTETILVFELKAGDGEEALGRRARVRHCRPHPVPANAPWIPQPPLVSRVFRRLFGVEPEPTGNDAWFIGCEFDRPLSDAELRQFVERLNALSVHEACA